MSRNNGEIIQELIVKGYLDMDIRYFPASNVLTIREDDLKISLSLNNFGYYNRESYCIEHIDGLSEEGPNLLVLSLILNT